MTIFLTYCSLGETSFELYFKCKWDLDNITIYIFYIKKIIQTFYLFENHEALFCLFPCIQLMQVVKKNAMWSIQICQDYLFRPKSTHINFLELIYPNFSPVFT